jgi:hypothetical protein
MEDPNYNNSVNNLDILLSIFCEKNGFEYKSNDPDEYDAYVPYKSISINKKKYRFSIRQYSNKLEYRKNGIIYYGVIDIFDEIMKWMLSEYEVQKKLL